MPGSFDILFPPTSARAFVPKWRARLKEIEGRLGAMATDAPAHGRLEAERRTLEDRIARRRRSLGPRNLGRDRAERRREHNQELANDVPLRRLLHPIIQAGRRDEGVARLYFFGMPVHEILDVTGVPEDRVRAVIAARLCSEVTAQLTMWLEQHGRSRPLRRRVTC